MKEILTVVIVLRTGGKDYTTRDVLLLAHHARKNYQGAMRILCIHDKVTEEIHLADDLTLIPMETLWPGWWSKMNMFAPSMEKYRPFLYMDIDTSVVGPLERVIPENKDEFMTLPNVYFPGHIGSGVMWLPANNEDVKKIWRRFIADPKGGMATKGGDQNFIEQTVEVKHFFSDVHVSSFKPLPHQHWRVNLKPNDSIIYFHGFPRIPVAAKRVDWIRKYVQYEKFASLEQTGHTIKKAYVINLDERKDRFIEFSQQCFPFPIERFPAIKMEPGIMGCNASHLAILNQDAMFPFVVFEDDCKMMQDWSVVDEAMKQLPEGWDLLYVGANLNEPLDKYSDNLFHLKNAWTTHGIVYGSQGVVDYIKQYMPKNTTPIDVFYSKDVLEKFKCFVVDPCCAIQRASFSDVNKGHRDYEKLMVENHEKHTLVQDFNKWFMAKGDTTHRLNYNLTSDSVVFDVGGYKGVFTSEITKKFDCKVYVFEPIPKYIETLEKGFKTNAKVVVLPYGISNENGLVKMNIDGDKTSQYVKSKEEVTVDVRTIDRAMDELGIEYIDLLKINIEGGEYPLLMDMIEKGLITKCGNIQVQFHKFVEDYASKYDKIRTELSKTHTLTYKFPYIWENWINIDGSYSQVGQDKFALSFFPPDYKGTFMDVGCNLPTNINNTLLLEQKGWTGTSFAIVDYSKQWKARSTTFVCADVLTCDYSSYDIPKVVDYLSLDIEGEGLRYEALKRLLEHGFEYKVITIEHDAYRVSEEKEKLPQRQILTEYGYVLKVPDVCNNGLCFEDWWINPKYITT